MSVDRDLSTAQFERESVRASWSSQLLTDDILVNHYERHQSNMELIERTAAASLSGPTASTSTAPGDAGGSAELRGLRPSWLDGTIARGEVDSDDTRAADGGHASRPLELFQTDYLAALDRKTKVASTAGNEKDTPRKGAADNTSTETHTLMGHAVTITRRIDASRDCLEKILFDLQSGSDAFHNLVFDNQGSVLSLELHRALASASMTARAVLSTLIDVTDQLINLRDVAVAQDNRVAATNAKMLAARESMIAASLERDSLKTEVWSHRAAQKLRAVVRRNSRRAASSSGAVRGDPAARRGSTSRRASMSAVGDELSLRHSLSGGAYSLPVMVVAHVCIDDYAYLWEHCRASMTAAVPLFKEALVASLGVACSQAAADDATGDRDALPSLDTLPPVVVGDYGPGGALCRGDADGAYTLLGFRDSVAALRWAAGFHALLNVLPWPAEFTASTSPHCPVVTRSQLNIAAVDPSVRRFVDTCVSVGDQLVSGPTAPEGNTEYIDAFVDAGSKIARARGRAADTSARPSSGGTIVRGLRARIGMHLGRVCFVPRFLDPSPGSAPAGSQSPVQSPNDANLPPIHVLA